MLLRSCSVALLLVMGCVRCLSYRPWSDYESNIDVDGERYTTQVIVKYDFSSEDEIRVTGFTSSTVNSWGTEVSRVNATIVRPPKFNWNRWNQKPFNFYLSKLRSWSRWTPIVRDFWVAPCPRVNHLSVHVYGVSVEPKTVSNLRRDDLTQLQLTGNNWATTSGLTLELPRLKKLSLSDNQIEALHEGLLKYCPYLEVLDLSRNKIKSFYVIHGSIYHLQNTLQELNLANNNMSICNIWYWRFFHNLKKINMSYNQVSSCQMKYVIPKNVAADLSSNNITTVDGIRYHFRVDRMVLAGQNISSLSEFEEVLSNIDYKLFEYSNASMALVFDSPRSINSVHVYESECIVNKKYISCKQNGSHIFPRRHSSLVNLSRNPIQIDRSSVLEMRVEKHVDLSQNYFEILNEDVPWQISGTEQLNLSWNSIIYISRYFFRNMTQLTVLDLSHNRLKHVELILYSSLFVLDISNNYLNRTTISHSSSNYTTKYLNLSHNSFSNILKVEWSQFEQFSKVDLGQNNFQCCGPEGHDSRINFLQHKSKILNINSTRALSCVMPINRRVEMTNKWLSEDHCQNLFQGWVAFGCLLMVTPLVVTAIDLLHYYTHQTERDLAHHLTHVKKQGLEQDEKHALECEYDAFVCHSHHEAHWVSRELVPNLENDRDGHRLCIHYRDFPLGSLIEENIETAMDKSRKVIVVVSRAFLRSYWCKMELTFAWTKMVSEGRNYIIVIELDKIPKGKRPPILSFLMESRTYLEWPEEPSDVVKQECWNRVRDALGKSLRRRQQEQSKRARRRNCTQTATEAFIIDC